MVHQLNQVSGPGNQLWALFIRETRDRELTCMVFNEGGHPSQQSVEQHTSSSCLKKGLEFLVAGLVCGVVGNTHLFLGELLCAALRVRLGGAWGAGGDGIIEWWS